MSPEREPKPQPLTIEQVAEKACEVALKFGNHLPTLVVQGRGEPYIIQLPELPDTHEKRFHAMRMSGFVLGTSGAIGSELQQVFFICEGWMSQIDRDQDPDAYPRPSQDPNRIDTLIISRLNASNLQASLRIYEMIRYQDEVLDLKQMDITVDESEEVRSYLLEAFVAGYQMANAD